MATQNLTWGACGSSSDGTYLYYGKLLIATNDPLTGTGWTLFGGAPLANSASSATITGLDDNVEYSFYNYCHCAASGNGSLVNFGPSIKYVCPTVVSVTSGFNSVSYTLNIPSSANNTGTWIQTVKVVLLNASGSTILYTNTHTSPFSASVSNSFSGLNPSTTYTLRVYYSNNASSKTNLCSSQVINTTASCVAPTVTASNITNSAFDINFSPVASGDTFSILLNSSTIATGITASPYTVTGLTGSTNYQIAVIKSCSTGGTATSSPQNVTTLGTPTCTDEVSSLGQSQITNNLITLNWVNPANSVGTTITYRACTSSTWLIPNASGNYTGAYLDSQHFQFTGLPENTCLQFLVQNICSTPASTSAGIVTSATTLHNPNSTVINNGTSASGFDVLVNGVVQGNSFSLAASGGSTTIYIAPISNATLTLRLTAHNVNSASLTTSAGTYSPSISGIVATFSNVTVSSTGATITFT